jgi:hypothetical protein
MMTGSSIHRATTTLAAAALALGLCAPAKAQDEAAVPRDGWRFGLTPYVWVASLKGDIAAIPGLPPASVDASFSDIIDNADFAFMLAGEARRGRFGIVADMSYLSLSIGGETPGPLFGGADVDSTTFFATVAGMYRVAADERFTLDLGAGARIWYVDTEINLSEGLLPARRVQDDAVWVDPLIGLRGTARLGHGFSLAVAGDIGGFGISSDFTWQALATLDYRFNDRFSVRAGYRHLEVDYESSGFVWDVRMSGPIIGATFRF